MFPPNQFPPSAPSTVSPSGTQDQAGSSSSPDKSPKVDTASGSSSLPHAHLTSNSSRANFEHIHNVASGQPQDASGAASIAAPTRITHNPATARQPTLGQLMSAKYYLQCDALEMPIDDLDDVRRLNDLTTSMEQMSTAQIVYGNRSDDVDRTNNLAMHLMIVGKEILNSTQHPSREENEEAYARSINSVGAATVPILKATTCGGGVSYLTYIHSDKLAPGEKVTHTLILSDDVDHEHVEVKPSQEEIARAASTGKTKYPAIGDTWLKGHAAMLKPHTRHAGYASVDCFSISHEDAANEKQHFISVTQQVGEFFGPRLGSMLENARRTHPEFPESERSPLEGKSIADPRFIRRATEALAQMNPQIRRSKGIAALDKAGVAAEYHQAWVDRLIEEAMTIHEYELE